MLTDMMKSGGGSPSCATDCTVGERSLLLLFSRRQDEADSRLAEAQAVSDKSSHLSSHLLYFGCPRLELRRPRSAGYDMMNQR